MSKSERINALIKKAGELNDQLNSLAYDIYNMLQEGVCDVHKQVLYEQVQRQYWACREQIANLA